MSMNSQNSRRRFMKVAGMAAGVSVLTGSAAAVAATLLALPRRRSARSIHSTGRSTTMRISPSSKAARRARRDR